MKDESQDLIPDYRNPALPAKKPSRKRCRHCEEWYAPLDLDEDGLCDGCNDTHAACPRCKKIFDHDELGGNSAYTKGNWPACDECLKPEERQRKEDEEA